MLANVYRLTDLARSFEISGAATSFRAFVEYLESEYESGDTGEAPVLEQEGGGVHLMTVHKAKGLEFPVVILADLTAKLTGREGGDRYCDPDRRLCAQRLLWCAPWELLDAAESEAKADEEEALRVAYVAATRARDLLVVAAIGDDPRPGWLSPLYDALYPEKDRYRISGAAPGCPEFGHATVLNRPPDYGEEVSVKPGLHRPRAGDHEVVWFDPAVLALKVDQTEGIEFDEVLRGTPDQAVDGLRRYQEWKDRRTARIEAASIPRFRVATAERNGQRRRGGIDRDRDGHVGARARGDRPAGSLGAWCTTSCNAPMALRTSKRWRGSGDGGTRPRKLECAAAAIAARAALEYLGRIVPRGCAAASRGSAAGPSGRRHAGGRPYRFRVVGRRAVDRRRLQDGSSRQAQCRTVAVVRAGLTARDGPAGARTSAGGVASSCRCSPQPSPVAFVFGGAFRSFARLRVLHLLSLMDGSFLGFGDGAHAESQRERERDGTESHGTYLIARRC